MIFISMAREAAEKSILDQLIAPGAALAGVVLTAVVGIGLTWWKRTQDLSDEKRRQQSDLYYISTQLIFVLEEFAMRCADVAADRGKPVQQVRPNEQVTLEAVYPIPSISFSSVDGNWKSLDGLVMFRTLELPVLLQDAIATRANRD